ncbi:protein P54-like [Rana temporaria]|uniref:protein P54-like n=1 Tax=Rana temporaria TaxID=8407 RepID=UPI001AAD326F|nr:protein P54-like [Rana temporaria]
MGMKTLIILSLVVIGLAKYVNGAFVYPGPSKGRNSHSFSWNGFGGISELGDSSNPERPRREADVELPKKHKQFSLGEVKLIKNGNFPAPYGIQQKARRGKSEIDSTVNSKPLQNEQEKPLFTKNNVPVLEKDKASSSESSSSGQSGESSAANNPSSSEENADPAANQLESSSSEENSASGANQESSSSEENTAPAANQEESSSSEESNAPVANQEGSSSSEENAAPAANQEESSSGDDSIAPVANQEGSLPSEENAAPAANQGESSSSEDSNVPAANQEGSSSSEENAAPAANQGESSSSEDSNAPAANQEGSSPSEENAAPDANQGEPGVEEEIAEVVKRFKKQDAAANLGLLQPFVSAKPLNKRRPLVFSVRDVDHVGRNSPRQGNVPGSRRPREIAYSFPKLSYKGVEQGPQGQIVGAGTRKRGRAVKK